MTSDQTFELFERISDLAETEQEEALRELEPDQAAQVRELIDADRFLEGSALGAISEPLLGQVERRIGAWRVIDVLGRGGMGIVYEVERADGEYEQTAALKLVPVAVDDPAVRRRFLSERQILARLEHPHICSLIDGGVSEQGQPYFVMELARGEDIIAFADDKRLTVEQRLHLFLQVCAAVQHAHRNLVVHRDLKPNNILVTEDGAKLLDFGIARLLEGGNLDATRTNTRLLTPRYAAPEQIRAEAATTSTDVYGLGLVLYELLAGTPAQDVSNERSSFTLERQICDVLPPPMSARFRGVGSSSAIALARRTTAERLPKMLRGDLDTIVGKAIEKDPQRRYESVEALTADIQRHLSSRPILARSPSALYRTTKFIKRNALLVGSMTAIATLLTILVGVQMSSAAKVREALAEAKLEAAKSQQTADFLSSLFEVADPTVNDGQQVSARELLDRGAERIQAELTGQPNVQGALMGEIGWIYHRLGLPDKAAALLDEALAIQGTVSSPAAADVSRNQHRLSIVEDDRGNYDRSIAIAREALERRRSVYGDRHPTTAESKDRLGSVLAFVGEYEEAEPLARSAVDDLVALADVNDSRTATARHNLAYLLRQTGQPEEAILIYRELLILDEARLGPDHPDVQSTRNSLAVALRRSGSLNEAETLYRQSLESRRKVLGDTHPRVGESLHNLARTLAQQGKLDEAANYFKQAIDTWSTSLPSDHLNFATARSNLAQLEIERGNHAEAEQLFGAALEGLTGALPGHHPRVLDTLQGAAAFHLNFGSAATSLQLAQKGLRSLSADGDGSAVDPLRTARLRVIEGRAAQLTGQATNATDAALADGLSYLTRAAPDDPLIRN